MLFAIASTKKPIVILTFAVLGCIMYFTKQEVPGSMLIGSAITLASVNEKKEEK